MARAIGANARLLMMPEATYGTAPGGNWKWLPFLSCDLDADVIGLGRNRDAAAPSAPPTTRLPRG
jgi:hypothetical protein